MSFYGVRSLRSVGKTGNSGKRPLNKVHATIILHTAINALPIGGTDEITVMANFKLLNLLE